MRDEYIFSFEIAVIDVFIKEIVAALSELEEERNSLRFGDVTVLLEIGLEVAEWKEEYPPEQYSKKK